MKNFVAGVPATLVLVSLLGIASALGCSGDGSTDPEAIQEWERLQAQAQALQGEGRYEEGAKVAKEALEVAEAALGPGHPDVATGLNNLAELYRAQGRYDEAEPLYERALAIWEGILGPQHLNVATGLNNLALLYHALGRYAEAEPLY